jgi:ABC-type uncharacterized transport system substrate-binding protein
VIPFWICDGFSIGRSKSKEVFCFALGALLLALSLPAEAQQPAKVPRIGYLAPSISASPALFDSFRRGLRELGYVEGKNIIFQHRFAEGKLDRIPALAAELVRLKVNVIVAVGSGEIRAAKEATTAIPIVMIRGGDPVGSGFVVSLARPGGNITGLATLRPELSGKRVELLNEIIPKLSRVAIFASSRSADYALVLKEVGIAAGSLGVKLQSLNILSSQDFETAFQEAAKARADAILFRVPGSILSFHRTEIAAVAIKSRLPVLYENAEEVDAGGLMSYGVNANDLYRRAGTYVDKIFKGAKPADLPVEQPTKFELVVNLKTAKRIGLTIPPNVLARADKVIK